MKKEKGQILIIVLAILMFLIIVIPPLVEWISNQARWSEKQYKKSIAFNLAQAGIDRGLWVLKSSTATWELVSEGGVIPGYNFDVVYNDISGGVYRVRFTSGTTSREVKIIAEGRDEKLNEVVAIEAEYRNQVIPGAVISKGIITWANAFSAHWGPIMAHNNINITDANAAKEYFPRKFSRQVVTSVPSYPRDENGLNPPNSGFDWWSDYPVPDLPQLDFTTLRSSAATNVAVYLSYSGEDSTYKYYLWKDWQPIGATPPSDWISSATVNTLNVYACSKMTDYNGPKWWIIYRKKKTTGAISQASTLSSCNLGGNSHNGQKHFQNPWRHPLHAANRVWYWDSDVIFTGSTGDDGCGIIGTVIVQGNLTNYCGDNLNYNEIGLSNCKIPPDAWQEYKYLTAKKAVDSEDDLNKDTSATNEYPGDDGYQRVRSTFRFGAETWSGGPTAANTDLGLKGFLYVGGDLNIEGQMDYYGALWVVGNVSRATGVSERSIIFYDDSLDLPALNVVLVRRSWKEIKPSSLPW